MPVEPLNGHLRDVCLHANGFATLDQAREILGKWKHAYNRHRRRGSFAD
jgi:putative transposase